MMLRHQHLLHGARARPAASLTPAATALPKNKKAAPLPRLAPPAASAAPTATTAKDTAAAFAAAVTGEWEGVTATFSPAGDALDLPDRFVPQAFRDWDMVPKDWQSQCSVPPLTGGGEVGEGAGAPSTAAATSPPPLRYAARRMMPTVGCEADAVAFTEDMAVIGGGPGVGGAALALAASAADGAYAAAPAALPADGRATVRVEACFPLPETSDKAGRPERLRVVQTFARDWTIRLPEEGGGGGTGAEAASAAASASPSPASLLRLESVELHREFREGPYTARVELLGCGGGAPPISKLERTPAEAVGGEAAGAAASSGASAAATTPPGSLADPAGVLTLLPLGAWSYVRRTGGDGLRAEAGVAVGGGAGVRQRRRVIAVEFAADGALSGASIVDEE